MDFSGSISEVDGYTVSSESKKLGGLFTEGVVESLTRRFIVKEKENLIFERERQLLQKHCPNAPEYAFLNMEKDGKKRYFRYGRAYDDAVERVEKICEKIWQSHRERFTSSEEVFAVLAKGLFTGEKLLFARLMESTFGKEAFRTLLEDSAL